MSTRSVKKRLRDMRGLKAELNPEQHKARKQIKKNAISIILGKAGSGKTFLACYVACELFFNKSVEKIVITRPTVTQEEIGFLPGEVEDKLDPWLSPIYDNLYSILGREMIWQMKEEDYIEIVPVSFMRGRTFTNAAIIVDEFQNLRPTMVKMIMSRIGSRSTMMLAGDKDQVDLNSRYASGYKLVSNGIEDISGVCRLELKGNHRHPVLNDLLSYFEKTEIAS